MDKKLGKGLDQLSQVFIDTQSSVLDLRQAAQENRHKVSTTRVICILGTEGYITRNAFLTCNLSAALSRLGMKIAILDTNSSLSCRNFFFGEGNIPGTNSGDKEKIIKEGPLGIKLIPFTLDMTGAGTGEYAEILKDLKNNHYDLTLISASISDINIQALAKNIQTFILIAPAATPEMIKTYQIIKAIYYHNPRGEIGLVVDGAEEEFKADSIFAKIAEVTSKYLNKEVLKFGNLCYKMKDLHCEKNRQTSHISIYDARLQASISNIAQIIVLRMNVNNGSAEMIFSFEDLSKILEK
ncbi:MAG: hypothetical protein ABH952_05975 [Candidatus Omnitrophota bacterium]